MALVLSDLRHHAVRKAHERSLLHVICGSLRQFKLTPWVAPVKLGSHTLAMYQHRGKKWEKWNDQLKAALPPMQSTTGDDEGSWAPVGPHGGSMGRVVSTAPATLSLEVYYRYLPFAFTKGTTPGPDAPPPAPTPPR